MNSALQLYDDALAAAEQLCVRFADGSTMPLRVDRFLAAADGCDAELLDGVDGPVLDLGCGPGRHLQALTARKIFALGVDISPVAVRLARGGGGRAIVGDVFGELPGAGTWRTALLIDGNIGIGGSPVRLLTRVRRLLHPAGRVLAELEPPDATTGATVARLESAGELSGWFPWARVSTTQVAALASAAGFVVARTWCAGERWFADLQVGEGPGRSY